MTLLNRKGIREKVKAKTEHERKKGPQKRVKNRQYRDVIAHLSRGENKKTPGQRDQQAAQ